MKLLRKLYNWVLHWAETPYGLLALVLISFAEATFFPIPPDTLLIALALGSRHKAFRFAFWCLVASVLGGLAGYGIGHFLWYDPSGGFSQIANFFFNNVPGFTQNAFSEIEILYNKWDFWIIFTAGFTPIPYKLFTVTSGIFNINLPMFILASLVSRGARFFLVAYLLWKFGEKIKNTIDKYFNLFAIAFTVLLIGGFMLIKYLL